MGARETGAGHHHLSGSLPAWVEQKDQEYAGLAIAYLWQAVELSANRAQSIHCRTALGAADRARKGPLSLERAAAQYKLVLYHAPDHLPVMTGLAAVLHDLGDEEGAS